MTLAKQRISKLTHVVITDFIFCLEVIVGTVVVVFDIRRVILIALLCDCQISQRRILIMSVNLRNIML